MKSAPSFREIDVNNTLKETVAPVKRIFSLRCPLFDYFLVPTFK